MNDRRIFLNRFQWIRVIPGGIRPSGPVRTASVIFAFLTFSLSSAALAQTFTKITVTAPTGCVTLGETIAVTAVFGPTNQANQTDDYSIGFGNASTIVWPGGCTTAYTTGSLTTNAAVTVVGSATVPATVSGYWTTVDVVGIQNSTYLCGGSTVIGSASITVCSTL